jgi:hypothetical protein
VETHRPQEGERGRLSQQGRERGRLSQQGRERERERDREIAREASLFNENILLGVNSNQNKKLDILLL